MTALSTIDSLTADIPPTNGTPLPKRRRSLVKQMTLRQRKRALLESNTLDQGRSPVDSLLERVRAFATQTGSCVDVMACANGTCQKVARVCPDGMTGS
jgi:hypothetical protein